MNTGSNRNPHRRAAVIDIGTSSVKIIVGELDESGAVRVLANLSKVTRLGEGVDLSHNLALAAQKRTVSAMGSLLRAIKESKPDSVRLVATSAVRDAVNRAEFAALVRSKLGLDLTVLSETEEGHLSFAAVAFDPALGAQGMNMAVVDVGGGSAEVVIGAEGRAEFAVSAKMGAVRLTERSLHSDPPTPEQMSDASAVAREEIARVVGNRRAERVVGVGGTVVNLARVHVGLEPDLTGGVHGLRMSYPEFGQVVSHLAAQTSEQRRSVVGLDPARADIIVGGGIVVESAMAVLGASELIVSTRGLRYGVLYELLGLA